MSFRINDPTFYQELKFSVVDTFEKLGYIRVPVNPSELFETYSIQALSYQSVYDASTVEGFSRLVFCPSGLSFTMSQDGIDYRYIACNLQESSGRVRFTKLHEMGHTVRKHLQDSETAEKEANYWAKYAIAPPVLVEELGATTKEEVAQYFGTSLECATYVLMQHENWLRHRRSDKKIDDKIFDLYQRGLLLEKKEREIIEKEYVTL